MNETISMDSYRHNPHVNIVTPRAVHVYPISYFHRLADKLSGNMADDGLADLPDDVFSVIIRDWLSTLSFADNKGVS